MRRRFILPFESKHEPMLPPAAFARRLAWSVVVAALIVLVSLGAGMLGYHHLERMTWIDAFVSAAMILSGMGPLAPLRTWEGKLFAGLYALYSGLVLLAVAGILFAPIFHRILHRFHLDAEEEQ